MLRSFFFFFFNDTATTEIYTLSLHDALPISLSTSSTASSGPRLRTRYHAPRRSTLAMSWRRRAQRWLGVSDVRSEEHTSELQSRLHLVCRLLLEKKKNTTNRAVTLSSAHRHT